MERSLTEKQEKFVEHYLQTLNVTQSALAAGYSPNGASQTGYKILRLPHIAEEVDKRKAELRDEMRDRFLGYAEQAIKTLYNVINDPESANRDKIAAARDILDRAGFKPVEKVEGRQEIVGEGGFTIAFLPPD